MTGEDTAARWDRWADEDDYLFGTRAPEPAADFLAALAGAGPGLDLGAGTGRVPRALAERGVPMTAVEISPAMAARLRRECAGLSVTVEEADMASFTLQDRFSVISSVNGSLFSLLTQQAQASCFQAAAAHLRTDGAFVVHAFVPWIIAQHPAVALRHLSETHVDLSVLRHDAAAQRVTFQEIRLQDAGLRLLPVDIRYAWPAELDLMARQAGLRLSARYGDFDRQPYTGASQRHVSVYTAH